MIVLDASAAIELILGTVIGGEVKHHLGDEDQTLHAPSLIDIEVAQTLRQFVFHGVMSPRRARDALDDLVDLDLERHHHDMLLPHIWRLRNNLTAYDAAYVALAEILPATLLTCDRAFAASPAVTARIHLIS